MGADEGWKRGDRLEGELASILGEWIGQAVDASIAIVPAPPNATSPLILLTLRTQPRNVGEPLIEQKCVMTPEAAAVLAENLQEKIREAHS